MRGVEEDIMEYMTLSTQLEHERKKHSVTLQYRKYKEEKDNEVKAVIKVCICLFILIIIGEEMGDCSYP